MILAMEFNYTLARKELERLNSQTYHYSTTNDVCTPMGCVEEMIDKIPQEFWERKDIKILDPCAGNGNFPSYLATKTDPKNIYLNDISDVRIENAKKILGNKFNIMKNDFLTFEDKEEYDLVIANPPYAKFTNGKRTAKNHNLSSAFILKSLKILKPNGYLVYIVPDNWMSFSDRNILPKKLSQYQFIYLNIHGAKHWFPKIGINFTWFILKKSPNEKPFEIDNNYIIKNKEFAKLDAGVNFIPLYYSEIVRNIINKTINTNNEKYKIETSSYLHKYNKAKLFSKKQDANHKYKIYHTPTQIIWSEMPHKYQDGWKVFISLTNKYKTIIDNDAGMTQSIAFIRCNSKEEAEKTTIELNKDVYVFLNNIMRYGNFNNIRGLQHFPKYGTFQLTKEEEDFIDKFNSKTK